MKTFAAVVALALVAPTATAEPVDRDGDRRPHTAADWIRDGGVAPQTRAPTREAASVRLAAGWDTSRDAAVGNAAVSLRVWRELRITGGAQWTDDDTLRPAVGASWRFSEQLGVSLDYRPEGLTEPEGELDLGVAATHRLGRVRVVGNLVYGQDPEARERDGEEAAALVIDVAGLWLGVGERLRFALADPPAGEPDWDFVAGPQLAIDLHHLILTGFVGFAARHVDDTSQRGLQSTLGVAHPF